MRLLALAMVLFVAGCSFMRPTMVATDVRVVEKPVPVLCRIDWPPRPQPHVANVQLTGNDKVDAVLIERAKEAELEARIAYELKLEAAAQACTTPN